jgi:hypothetical protein
VLFRDQRLLYGVKVLQDLISKLGCELWSAKQGKPLILHENVVIGARVREEEEILLVLVQTTHIVIVLDIDGFLEDEKQAFSQSHSTLNVLRFFVRMNKGPKLLREFIIDIRLTRFSTLIKARGIIIESSALWGVFIEYRMIESRKFLG